MKTKQLILRWSLVTSGFIALFWAIYYLIAGNVPTITSIEMTPNWIIALPFGISRWWDILIGPIWSTIIILFFIFTSKESNKGQWGAVLNVGLFIGLSSGLIFGLAVSLVLGLVIGLVFGLVMGLTAGLVFGPLYGLGAGLIAGLRLLNKQVTSTNFWTKIWNWLLVR